MFFIVFSRVSSIFLFFLLLDFLAFFSHFFWIFLGFLVVSDIICTLCRFERGLPYAGFFGSISLETFPDFLNVVFNDPGSRG